jgi:hypothetical protein
MKATRASVEYYFTGDIEGAANVEYLMFYKSFDPQDPHKAEAQYVGLIKIIGKLKGKPGTFVLADSGNFHSGTATSKLTILPGSGTGELSKIAGTGSYKADQTSYHWEMDVTL